MTFRFTNHGPISFFNIILYALSFLFPRVPFILNQLSKSISVSWQLPTLLVIQTPLLWILLHVSRWIASLGAVGLWRKAVWTLKPINWMSQNSETIIISNLANHTSFLFCFFLGNIMKLDIQHLKESAKKVFRRLGWFDDPEDEETSQPPAARNHNRLDWPKILVVFCLATAIDMALLSAQIHSQLPAIFCFLGLTIIVSFTCFFVSKCIPLKYKEMAKALERLGIFFGVTAIFISIAIPFSLWFKCVTCFIYVLCWLTILFCNYFRS